MKSDKELERDRYENRARVALADNLEVSEVTLTSLPPALRSPYVCYQSQILKSTELPAAMVLEIGAGTGIFSGIILQDGARLIATDISTSSLEILNNRLQRYPNVDTSVADMEALPFADASFDIVCSAGSLSYGNNTIVMREIYRVLKPQGRFICVDSLNHNPIYRLNRWLQCLRKQRSRSTIERMPTQNLIQSYGANFGRVNTWYFGSIVWLVPMLDIIFDSETVGRISGRIDALVNVTRSAFKFVMVAEKIQ